MRREMTVTVLLLIAAIMLIALAIAWVIYIEAPKRSSALYVRELAAETELHSRLKPVVFGASVIAPVRIDGTVSWLRHDAKLSAQSAEPAATDEDVAAWKAATDLVVASVEADGNSDRLIPAAQFGSGSSFDAAVTVLRTAGWVMTGNRGTFVKKDVGTVAKLLPLVATKSAVMSLPRPGERVGGERS